MLDLLVSILFVTLFVLGLFGLVQWVLGFFSHLYSARLNPPVGKWWLILLGVVFLLNNLSELINSGSLWEWTKDEYLNVYYVCAATYMIIFIWRSTTQPTKESTQTSVSKNGDTGQT